MFYILEKQISLDPRRRSTGVLKTALDKLLMLSMIGYVQKEGELLFDWEDQYTHLQIIPQGIQSAFSKSDEFQFGKLLSQMAGVDASEIDEAYQKMNEGRSTPSPGDQNSDPSQRIGSLLVGAHLISPHMIGTILKTQIVERTLRILSLKEVNFTFEPKAFEKKEADLYSYMDPTVRMEELLFHAMIWRTQMKDVNQILEFFSIHHPVIHLKEDYRLPESIAVTCRLDPEVFEEDFFSLIRGKQTTLLDWLNLRPKQKTFTRRFVSAFLLTHLGLWKETNPKKDSPSTYAPPTSNAPLKSFQEPSNQNESHESDEDSEEKENK